MFSLPIESKKRLFFLAAGMFAMGFEDYLFAGLLPGISVSLHSSVVAVAQGCTAYGLTYVLSIPLCVFLLSRMPTRQVLIVALSLFMAGNLITILSPNLSIYLLGRIAAGFGCGLFLPVAVASATRGVDARFQGRALSFMWGANSAGAVVGVPLGLWLTEQMGWRFTVILILILVIYPLLGIVIHKQEFRVDTLPPSLGEQFRLLLNTRVLSVVSVTLLTATGCLGLYSYITQVLAGTENSSEIAFSLWSIGGLLGIIGVGHVVDRTGKPQSVMILILAILLLVIIAIPLLRGIPVFGLLPFFVWGTMSWASVTPQQYSLIKIKADQEAILVALNTSAVSLGGAVGTALGGVVLASGLAAEKLPYVTSIFVFCALVFQVLLNQSQQSDKSSL